MRSDTHDQRQSLEVVSETSDSLDDVGNDLCQDGSDNREIISLPRSQFDCDISRLDVGDVESSLGGRGRSWNPGGGGVDGIDDRLKGRLGIPGRDIRSSEDGNGSSLRDQKCFAVVRQATVDRATHDRGLEVVDHFNDGLPLLDLNVVDGRNGRSDDTLESGQARDE